MLLPFTLTVDSLTADLLVLTVRGRESINQPYCFEAQAVCADPVDQEAIPGRARLTLNVGKESRRVHGIVDMDFVLHEKPEFQSRPASH